MQWLYETHVLYTVNGTDDPLRTNIQDPPLNSKQLTCMSVISIVALYLIIIELRQMFIGGLKYFD